MDTEIRLKQAEDLLQPYVGAIIRKESDRLDDGCPLGLFNGYNGN
jgi:hypothetical protein